MNCPSNEDSDADDFANVSFLELVGMDVPSQPSAESNGREPSAMFMLARKLMGKGYPTAASCKKFVELFCKQERLRFRDSWIEFNLAWEEVKYPDYGVDGFEVATAKAKLQSAVAQLDQQAQAPADASTIDLVMAALGVAQHVQKRHVLILCALRERQGQTPVGPGLGFVSRGA